jgi:hypothetical protein
MLSVYFMQAHKFFWLLAMGGGSMFSNLVFLSTWPGFVGRGDAD